MAKSILTVDARTGLFRRDLGRKQRGAQHRFYLGRDRTKATLANQRLDLLWDAVKAYFARYRDGDPYPVTVITSAAPNAGAAAATRPQELPLIPDVFRRRSELEPALAGSAGCEMLRA